MNSIDVGSVHLFTVRLYSLCLLPLLDRPFTETGHLLGDTVALLPEDRHSVHMAARLLSILPTQDHPEEDTPAEVVVIIISEARGLVTVGLSIRGVALLEGIAVVGHRLLAIGGMDLVAVFRLIILLRAFDDMMIMTGKWI